MSYLYDANANGSYICEYTYMKIFFSVIFLFNVDHPVLVVYKILVILLNLAFIFIFLKSVLISHEGMNHLLDLNKNHCYCCIL